MKLFQFFLLCTVASCSFWKSDQAAPNTTEASAEEESKDSKPDEKKPDDKATEDAEDKNKDDDDEEEDDDEGVGSDYTEIELLFEGIRSYDGERYNLAKTMFSKLAQKFPASPVSVVAELKAADSSFFSEKYPEAIGEYRDFNNVHSTHEAKPYSMFQIGNAFKLSYQGLKQDETPLKEAVKAYIDLINQFPNSFFSQKAKLSILECDKLLLESEKDKIGFYLKTGKDSAAKTRYDAAKKTYSHVPNVDEILDFKNLNTDKSTNQKEDDKLVKTAEDSSSQASSQVILENPSDTSQQAPVPEPSQIVVAEVNKEDVKTLPDVAVTQEATSHATPEEISSESPKSTPVASATLEKPASPTPTTEPSPTLTPTPIPSPTKSPTIEVTAVASPKNEKSPTETPTPQISQENFNILSAVSPSPSSSEPKPQEKSLDELKQTAAKLLEELATPKPNTSPTSQRKDATTNNPTALQNQTTVASANTKPVDNNEVQNADKISKATTLAALEKSSTAPIAPALPPDETESVKARAFENPTNGDSKTNGFLKEAICETDEGKTSITLMVRTAPTLRSSMFVKGDGAFGENTYKYRIAFQDKFSIVPTSNASNEKGAGKWTFKNEKRCQNTMDKIKIVEQSKNVNEDTYEPNSLLLVELDSSKERKINLSISEEKDKIRLIIR